MTVSAGAAYPSAAQASILAFNSVSGIRSSYLSLTVSSCPCRVLASIIKYVRHVVEWIQLFREQHSAYRRPVDDDTRDWKNDWILHY
jgi:hypothetical protein